MRPLTILLAPALATLALLATPSPAQEADPAVRHSFFVLCVTPLRSPESFTLRVSTDGLVDRWDTSGGKVTRAGTAQLGRATGPSVALAESVPAKGDMGDGVREGDVYVLATQPSGAIRAFLEPRAPDALRRLVEDAERLSRALDMEPAKQHFLRTIPVAPGRAEKLRSAGAAPAWETLAADVRAVADRARESPYEFVPIPSELLEAVRDAVTPPADAPGSFFALADASWIEVELWPPA
jgi:hypothetical protein